MKVLTVLLVILMACLFLGCAEEEAEKLAEEYAGFLKMKGGEWAEHTAPEVGKIRYEYIGTDTIGGRECLVMEFETVAIGEKTISQVWVDKEKGELTLYVVKMAGIVMKLNVADLPASSTELSEGSSGETPDKYAPGTQISNETYITPTGKTVKAAVFKTGSTEEWVSGNVPFGIVKIIEDGKPVTELYDFSFSGAKRDISKEEIENAVSLPGIPNFP